MTRAWAAECSASGVRVNAIAPGPLCTPTKSGPEFITALEKLGSCVEGGRLVERGVGSWLLEIHFFFALRAAPRELERRPADVVAQPQFLVARVAPSPPHG